MGTIIYDTVTLTLEFDQFLKNFNLSNNFWKVSAILHMNISCDKIFLLVSRYLPLSGAFVFHKHILLNHQLLLYLIQG